MSLSNEEKILLYLIRVSGKDYLTYEEFDYFKKYLQANIEKDQLNFSLFSWNLNDTSSKINTKLNYYLLYPMSTGVYISNLNLLTKVLEKIFLNETIIKTIQNYYDILYHLIRYIVYPLKDYINESNYIEIKEIYNIVVKAYVFEKSIKYDWEQGIINKYQALVINPGISNIERNFVEVAKVFNNLDEAIIEKDKRNKQLKAKYMSTNFSKVSIKDIIANYNIIKEKYEEIENLILTNQQNVKVFENDLSRKRSNKI